jgi:hypothetical protein
MEREYQLKTRNRGLERRRVPNYNGMNGLQGPGIIVPWGEYKLFLIELVCGTPANLGCIPI